jgi:hypothetical protein
MNVAAVVNRGTLLSRVYPLSLASRGRVKSQSRRRVVTLTGQPRPGAAFFLGPGSRPTAYAAAMVCPASWSRLTGESPVRVGTGAPGSRPRFVAERRRAKRGVKSLFGGSKRAGRSIKRTLQPRHRNNGGAEPLMSRRRPCPGGPVPGSAFRVPPGYGGWHVRTVWTGTGEARLPGLRQAKTAGISRW